MNICLLASGFLPKVGGLELVVHHLATALCQLGHQVVVVAPNTGGSRSDHAYPYTVVNFGFRGSSRFKLTSLLAVTTMYYVVNKFDIDVIHVHDVFAPGTWARHFKRLKRDIPTVGTPHGEDINKVPSIYYGRRLDPATDNVIRRNIKSFDLLTAISKSVHQELAGILQNEALIRDIPNGVWTSSFQSDADRMATRIKYGVPADSLALISIGRNVPVKGFELGLRSVAKVLESGYNVSYILVGRDMEPILEKAHRHDIAESVFTPGELSTDQLAALCQACDIYLSTSSMESFGLTTLEAMSCGLPCVVTDVPGNRDIVSSDYGILAPKDSEDALAIAIRTLIDDASRRAALGKKARNVASDYDWAKIASMYVDAYQEAIDSMGVVPLK